MEQNNWYEAKGFTKNPFSLEPIGISEEEQKGFIDREIQKEEIEKLIQQKSGAIILIADIGVGKSSLINRSENYARKRGKIVLRIDPRATKRELKPFLNLLIGEIERDVSISSKKESFLRIIERLNESKKVWKDNDFTKTKQALEDFFNEFPTITLIDDLDKLNVKESIDYLKNEIDFLPKNFVLIVTGDLNQVLTSYKIINLLYAIFDKPLLLESIKSKDSLKTFVEGRIKAYSKGHPQVDIGDDLIEVLIDRTRGNLREIFRYLGDLIKLEEISKESLIKIIKEVDKAKLEALTNIDKQLLKILSGNRKSILEVSKDYEKLDTKRRSPITLRLRLENLAQMGLVFKEKDEYSNRIIYSSPKIMRELIPPNNKDSWSS